MTKQLGDEERIATGVIGERSCESGRRVGLAERCQQALHVGLRKRAQYDRVSEPLADEFLQRRLDGLGPEHLTRLTTDAVEESVKGSLRCLSDGGPDA